LLTLIQINLDTLQCHTNFGRLINILFCHLYVFFGYQDEIQVIIELKGFILWCIMAENFDSI